MKRSIGDAQYIGFSREDRDLLIELRTSVSALRQDVYTIKDTISASIVDHETRLRLLETSAVTLRTEKYSSERFTRLGGTILIFIVGVVEFIINRYLK